MMDETYIRYLLAFKLWKKVAGKDQISSIVTHAINMLKPPVDFAVRLKVGSFANVLPFPFGWRKGSVTNFFMRSPFSVKEKAKVKPRHII